MEDLNPRQVIRRKKELWNKQRELQNAKKDLNMSGGDASELIERLALKTGERLMGHLQKEQNSKRRVQHAEEDASIKEELMSNTCPICFELFLPPDNSPILLFPCGHTFCRQCLTQCHKKTGKKICPFCRERIKSDAVNISLQNLIKMANDKEIQEKKNKAKPREVVQAKQSSGDHSTSSFKERLEYIDIRKSVLVEELNSVESQLKQKTREIKSTDSTLDVLTARESQIEKKMDELKQELRVLKEHISMHQDHREKLVSEKNKLQKGSDLVQATLLELREERDKIVTLSQLK